MKITPYTKGKPYSPNLSAAKLASTYERGGVRYEAKPVDGPVEEAVCDGCAHEKNQTDCLTSPWCLGIIWIRKEPPGLRSYVLELEITAYSTVTALASSEEEAKEKAQAHFEKSVLPYPVSHLSAIQHLTTVIDIL